MAGTDTIRGIAFQQAQALSEVVSMLIKPECHAIQVEGSHDSVDYAVLDSNLHPIQVWQAKTRQEPRQWSASDLAPIIMQWSQWENADQTQFTFVTDASLNSNGVALGKLIRSAREGADDAAIAVAARKLSRKGVRLPSVSLLCRVEFHTQAGTVQQVLDRAEYHLLDLLVHARPATADDARAGVDKLFRHLFTIGCENDPGKRLITRQEAATMLGLAEADLLGGLGWTDEVSDVYRTALAATEPRGDLVALNVMPVRSAPRVLRIAESSTSEALQSVEPIEALLDAPCTVLVGATGEGKMTTLRAVEILAATSGAVPILLLAQGHSSGALGYRVRSGVEKILKARLSAGGAQALLQDQQLLLLIDGASEVDDAERKALREDLQALAERRSLRLILTGRDLAKLRQCIPGDQSVAAYRVTPLDGRTRREIARALAIPDANRIVSQLESSLGMALDNPMLFSMALSNGEVGLGRGVGVRRKLPAGRAERDQGVGVAGPGSVDDSRGVVIDVGCTAVDPPSVDGLPPLLGPRLDHVDPVVLEGRFVHTAPVVLRVASELLGGVAVGVGPW